jgi:hypothetical protein
LTKVLHSYITPTILWRTFVWKKFLKVVRYNYQFHLPTFNLGWNTFKTFFSLTSSRDSTSFTSDSHFLLILKVKWLLNQISRLKTTAASDCGQNIVLLNVLGWLNPSLFHFVTDKLLKLEGEFFSHFLWSCHYFLALQMTRVFKWVRDWCEYCTYVGTC